jgi:CRP-like cAMP-binding protein
MINIEIRDLTRNTNLRCRIAANENHSDTVAARLEQLAPLSADDRAAFRWSIQASRRVMAGRDFDPVGPSRPRRFIQNGFAGRYTQFPDGRRQITELLLPGDFCDSQPCMMGRPDDISALTQVVYCEISGPVFTKLVATHPRIGEAIQRSAVLTDAALRERVASLGIRTAKERLAHLLCEVFLRCQAVGLTTAMQCHFPLAEADLGTLLGLSASQAGRNLKALQADGRIRIEAQRLTIWDFDGLQRVGQFDPRYLGYDPASAGGPSADGRWPGSTRR